MIQVLWLAGVKKWAYENIAERFAKALGPGFEHRIVYATEPGFREKLSEPTDVVVCFSPRFLRFLGPDLRRKTVLRLDGYRAFE